MQVVVALEHRFTRTPDGAIWTQTMFPYPFWQRYLAVFEGVKVVSRVLEVEGMAPGATRADGPGVRFARVPHYIGPWEYLLNARQVTAATRNVVERGDAVILRLGSHIAGQIEPSLRRNHHPYGVEVVNDPYDVFAPGAVRHPLRPFFRWWFTRQQQRQCAHAAAAAYVTEYSLQRRYPPGQETFSTYYSSVELSEMAFRYRGCPDPRNLSIFSTHYSDVELLEAAFIDAIRPYCPKGSFKLITVGTLAQLYKAPDVLIDAVALCVQEGLDLSLTLVGDGLYRPRLEAQVAQLGLSDRIRFLGELPAGEAVRSQLDQADVFVLPSRQEGLPRAMIEAMARGLPCIGSQVGGIPELLPAEDRVPAGEVQALARKIREVVTDPDRMVRMSRQALSKAQTYRDDILQQRRTAFYRYLRDTTADWLADSHGPGLQHWPSFPR